MSQIAPLAALPAPFVPRGPDGLSRKAKAAIIVQFILNEGADVPLSSLPEDLQTELTVQLGSLRYVDRATLNAVVEEFSGELESVGLSLPGGISGALDALEGKINPRTSARLRKEAGVRHTGDPWVRINGLPVDRMVAMVQSESIEIAAVMMSKIDVSKAAEVLTKLPGDRARRITFATSMTSGVTPEAVDRIGLSLAAQLEAEPEKAFEKRPDERVGAILNYAKSAVREELLTQLEEEDKDFAEAVRKSIFTFANIPERLNAIDVPKITRDVDPDKLATAIAAAESDEDRRTVEFLLENISKRLAAGLQEEAENKGTVKPKVAEAAMASVVAAIRDLVQVGEIELLDPDAEE